MIGFELRVPADVAADVHDMIREQIEFIRADGLGPGDPAGYVLFGMRTVAGLLGMDEGSTEYQWPEDKA